MNASSARSLPLAAQLELACLLEATARKPGNVHPAAAFVDLRYADFVAAAATIGTVLAAPQDGVGAAVLAAIRATQRQAASNVNLGIVLLLAPLAAVPADQPLARAAPNVLQRTTVADAAAVYAAIRLARPGGLGQAPEQDVAEQPTQTLRDVMRLAADRDAIAAQYARGFVDVAATAERLGVWFRSFTADGADLPHLFPGRAAPAWEAAVIAAALELHGRLPDSLIQRKCGPATAAEASRRARDVLARDWPRTTESRRLFWEFDAWLRADGHRRNPGTTADLIVAGLFWALRCGTFAAPERSTVLQHAAAIQNAAGPVVNP